MLNADEIALNRKPAGKEGGNGGNTLTCFTSVAAADQVRETIVKNRLTNLKKDPLGGLIGQVKSVHSLDYYEATLPRLGQPPAELIKPNGRNYVQILAERMEKLRHMNIFLYDLLREFEEKVPLSRFVRSGAAVIEIDDSGETYIPPRECLRLQIAYQTPSPDGKFDVVYDGRLFEKMNSVNQAALILHERVYRMTIEKLGSQNARAATLAVGFILRKDLTWRQTEESLSILARMGWTESKVRVRQLFTSAHYTPIFWTNDGRGGQRFLADAPDRNGNEYFSVLAGDSYFKENDDSYRVGYPQSRKNPILKEGTLTSITIKKWKGDVKNLYPLGYTGYLESEWRGIPPGSAIAVDLDHATGKVLNVTIIALESEDTEIDIGGIKINRSNMPAKIDEEGRLISAMNLSIQARGTKLNCVGESTFWPGTPAKIKRCPGLENVDIDHFNFSGDLAFTEDGTVDTERSVFSKIPLKRETKFLERHRREVGLPHEIRPFLAFEKDVQGITSLRSVRVAEGSFIQYVLITTPKTAHICLASGGIYFTKDQNLESCETVYNPEGSDWRNVKFHSNGQISELTLKNPKGGKKVFREYFSESGALIRRERIKD